MAISPVLSSDPTRESQSHQLLQQHIFMPPSSALYGIVVPSLFPRQYYHFSSSSFRDGIASSFFSFLAANKTVGTRGEGKKGEAADYNETTCNIRKVGHSIACLFFFLSPSDDCKEKKKAAAKQGFLFFPLDPTGFPPFWTVFYDRSG